MIKIVSKTTAEISESIRTLIRNGDLRPGDSLSPVRDLAEVLAVNRNALIFPLSILTSPLSYSKRPHMGTTRSYLGLVYV